MHEAHRFAESCREAEVLVSAIADSFSLIVVRTLLRRTIRDYVADAIDHISSAEVKIFALGK